MTTSFGFIGKVALLLPESYADIVLPIVGDDDDELMKDDDEFQYEDERKYRENGVIADYFEGLRNEPEVFKHRRFLESHLFYLKNPSEPSRWIFITYPSKGDDITLGTSKGLQVYDPRGMRSWDHEATEFNKHDFLTIVGCLFIRFPTSTGRLLTHAQAAIQAKGASVVNSQNLKALKRDGNSFEVSAAVCVCDSSHYEVLPSGICRYTFKSQKGDSFVRNVIFNLTLWPGLRKGEIIKVTIPSNLSTLLSSATIPFLFSIDNYNETVDFLLEKCNASLLHRDDPNLLPNLLVNQGFVVQQYERTSDFEQIDGKFSFLSNQVRHNFVCDCKKPW